MEQGFPRVETMTGAEARRRVRAFQESWQVDLEPIDRVEDRRIPGPAGEIPVRIYRPASPGPLPALVGFHGGGWVIGDLDGYEGMCQHIANSVGCLLVSVDYRLAPEHPFPAALEDRENAEGYFLEAVTMRWYWRQYLGDSADGSDPYASPLRAPDLSHLPPALIITAGYDPLRDEGEAYGRRLQAAGVDATVRRYETMFHGFFGFGLLLDAALPANEDAFAALRAAFGTD